MEPCGKNEFEISLERTAPQAAFGISVNFVLFSSGLTPDSDSALFYLNVEEGLCHNILLLTAN